MAMYPDREDVQLMMLEPGTTVPKRNGEVVRIVMHQTWAPQTIKDQAAINVREWTKATKAARTKNPNSQFGISAHFTVEMDGRVIQHVDTVDMAKGTAVFAGGSVHIEFAAQNEEMTKEQLHAGASLMAWIQKEHPAVKLVVVGTSNEHPGPDDQKGITCHSFVELVGKRLGRIEEAKVGCPGPKIINHMNRIAVLASVRRALM